MATLTIIRGLPGSGKSTMARAMGISHFEADMWMTDADGSYRFDPRNLKRAHAECLNAVRGALKSGKDCVVSNTFTQRWEMKPYYDLGFPVREIVATGDYGNIHGVPADKIEAMRERWEA